MKLTTAICTGLLASAPAVALAQGALPYPDFNAIAKTGSQPTDNKPMAAQPTENKPLAAQPTEYKPLAVQDKGPETMKGGSMNPTQGASNMPGSEKTQSRAEEGRAPAEPYTGRSSSSMQGGTQEKQKREPVVQGATNYQDFDAIKKTAEPSSQPQR